MVQTIDFLFISVFLDGKKSHELCNSYSVRKIVNVGVYTTLVRAALLYGTFWVDEPSPFVVSGVANYRTCYLNL